MASTLGPSSAEDLWVFGYGSLVWKNTDLNYSESVCGFIYGFERRFWQGSTDHRGTPSAPGIVVSLYTPEDFEALNVKQKPRWRVAGRAFHLRPEAAADTLAGLDHREKDGYSRSWAAVHDAAGNVLVNRALVYVADTRNVQFAGALEEEAIARIIAVRRGPSGTNKEYIERLAVAVRALGDEDPHIEAVLKHLCKLDGQNNLDSSDGRD